MAILEDVSRRAHFLTSPEKVRWGTSVVYLGLHIDSTTRAAIVMPSKLFKSLTMLHVLRLAVHHGNIEIPVSFALKVAGNAQWLAQNFRLGRLHTPALWQAAERLRTHRAHAATDCPGLHAACEWWAQAAARNLLRPHRFVRSLDIPSLLVALDTHALEATATPARPGAIPRLGAARWVVSVLTDASGEDEGGAIGGCWCVPGDYATHAFWVPLTPTERAWRAICAKELLAMVTWLERFGHLYRGAVVLFGTDNAGNVFTVNRLRLRAEDTIMAELLGRLLSAADAFDIECLVWWCPRYLNGISDDLSKCLVLANARRVSSTHGLAFHEPPATSGF